MSSGHQWLFEHKRQLFLISELAALLLGIVAARSSLRARMFGWIGIVLLVVAGTTAFARAFEFPNYQIAISVSLVFCFAAPFSVLYSFYALRRASDRTFALIAFAAAIPIGVFFVICLVLTAFACFGVHFKGSDLFLFDDFNLR